MRIRCGENARILGSTLEDREYEEAHLRIRPRGGSGLLLGRPLIRACRVADPDFGHPGDVVFAVQQPFSTDFRGARAAIAVSILRRSRFGQRLVAGFSRNRRRVRPLRLRLCGQRQ